MKWDEKCLLTTKCLQIKLYEIVLQFAICNTHNALDTQILDSQDHHTKQSRQFPAEYHKEIERSNSLRDQM